MAPMTWFKLYDEIADDPKILSLDDGTVVLWIRLMCLANRNEAERGVIARAPRAGLAKQLHTTLDQLEAALELFASDDYRMLTVRDDGAIVLTNWDKRNARKPSDDPAAVAERKKRYSERAQNATGTRSERVQNADGTPAEREENALRVRDRYRDRSTPLTPLGGSGVLPNNFPEEFVRFKNAYPVKNVRSTNTFAAWENALVDGAEPEQLIAAAQNYAKAVAGRPKNKCKLPDNFLKEGIWADYVDGIPEIDREPDNDEPRYNIPDAEASRRMMAEWRGEVKASG